ncbi:tartrate-resistant acid phosphatase type 5 family protein [Belliella sp. R4-6]|uniref:acid phosphatase n=1 Tax=Belliella alkalica TaxID=1730871 RepID=A0ABS9VF52_9BACT|nr:tartrate-resistant acid phosphatase type 5 family protein [Belliella alkalica]MCH7415064.1 tartrate-resistant acid phosphatase type 5 family protein [Belliella alkalica]
MVIDIKGMKAHSWIFSVFSILTLFTTNALCQEISPESKAVKFIAIGDWGRNGDDHQLDVADQLLNQIKKHKPSFLISTGDNFYPNGVRSIHDPLWKHTLEDVYKNYHFQLDWYAILGNHDYLGDPDAQVAYSSISRRWNMPARYYSKKVPIRNSQEHALLLFIDTNSLIPQFYANPTYGPNVAKTDSLEQKKWMKEQVNTSGKDAKWIIVVGHHPMYSGGRVENYDTVAIRKSLKEYIKELNVDLFLSGHDHSLQYLVEDGIHQVISGSGSEVTPSAKLPYTKFTASEAGFMLFSIDSNQIKFDAINKNGVTIFSGLLEK